MAETSDDRTPAGGVAPGRLWLPLALTRAGMAAERALAAFWPALTVALAGAAAVLFGLFARLPGPWATAALAALGLALAAALAAGLWRFRVPGRAAALARLDASLPGRPLSALGDAQAIGAGDAASAAVWRAHLRRMAARAAAARAVRPDLRLSRRDPFALRYAALTAFVAALVFGVAWRGDGLGALAPAGPGAAAIAAGPSYEGWIEPPGHTGKPTIYMNEAEGRGPLSVPEGSRVTLRLYGEVGALSVTESVSGAPVDARDPSAPAQEFDVARDGEIALSGAREVGWSIVATPDAPPVAELTEEIGRSIRGQMTLAFRAEDDYGVMSGTAEIALDLPEVDRRHGLAVAPEPRETIVLDLPMPFSGDRAAFEDRLTGDLSEHPWANLPVTVTLTARDAAEQEGRAAPVQVLLPGRRFFDPLAAAIAEQRRDLLWSRENGRRVAQVLRTATHRPEDLFESETAYLITRTAIRRLEAGLTIDRIPAEVRDEVAELLWKAALLIEEGDLSDALERLRRAEERLSEALENGASEEEIAELMDELRRAMRDYMEQMAREAQENDGEMTAEDMQNMEQITGDQLQEMMDRIEELARQGRMAEAQQLLEQLRRMMENMRMAQDQPGQQGQQGQGQQALQDLQDTLRQQQGLSDDAFRRLQEDFNNPGQQGQGQQGQAQRPGEQGQQGQGQPGQGQQQGQGRQAGPGEGGEMPSAEELARRQEALRQLLEQQREGLPGQGTAEGEAARDALDRAGRAMGEAAEDLDQGDLPGALDNQGEAMQALREGIQNLGEALAQQQQPGQGQQPGQDFGQVPPSEREDPLGRRAGNTGRVGTEENMLPENEIYRRSQELMDEIRRRSGERARPELERDYLERLLDRF